LARLLLGIVLVLPALGCVDEPQVAQPPLTLPFIGSDTRSAGVLFRVEEEGPYALSLVFNYPEGGYHAREHALRVALGDGATFPRPNGRPLSVEVELKKEESDRFKPVVERSIDSHHLTVSSWSEEAFNKKLLKLRLEPGDYKLIAHAVDVDPAFEQLKVDLRLARSYGSD
jgi:hypothetical protein